MVAEGLVFGGRPASQTHIPTRNRYLVSSRGLKVQVSVWGHRHYPYGGGLWEPPPSSWMSEVPLQNIKLWKTFPSVSLSQALIHTVYSVISLGPSVTYPQR